MADDKDQRIALWRYGIIAPLLALPTERGRLKAEIARLADRLYEHPLKGQTRLGFGTIEQWLYIYKRDGFDGLKPVLRKDQGTSRRIDDVIAEAIETLATTRLPRESPQVDAVAGAASLSRYELWPRPSPSAGGAVSAEPSCPGAGRCCAEPRLAGSRGSSHPGRRPPAFPRPTGLLRGVHVAPPLAGAAVLHGGVPAGSNPGAGARTELAPARCYRVAMAKWLADQGASWMSVVAGRGLMRSSLHIGGWEKLW